MKFFTERVKENIQYGMGVGFVLNGTAIYLGSRFSHPDMTNIRWFLNYWYVWVTSIAVVVGGAYLMESSKEEK